MKIDSNQTNSIPNKNSIFNDYLSLFSRHRLEESSSFLYFNNISSSTVLSNLFLLILFFFSWLLLESEILDWSIRNNSFTRIHIFFNAISESIKLSSSDSTFHVLGLRIEIPEKERIFESFICVTASITLGLIMIVEESTVGDSTRIETAWLLSINSALSESGSASAELLNPVSAWRWVR